MICPWSNSTVQQLRLDFQERGADIMTQRLKPHCILMGGSVRLLHQHVPIRHHCRGSARECINTYGIRSYRTADTAICAAIGRREASIEQRRRLLPQNLEATLRHLTDEDLRRLLVAVEQEQDQRAMSLDGEQTQSVGAPELTVSGTSKVEGLTQSQINLIRASIKAGVKPSVLSRQFGISQAQIKSVLRAT